MTIDRAALRDRLLASALAAPLRDRARFCEANYTVATADTCNYVRAIAEEQRVALFATHADVDAAFVAAATLWERVLPVAPCRYRVLAATREFAQRLLYPSGRTAVLNAETSEPCREILRWRFVTLALPPSILIAAATADGSAAAESVQLLNPSIAPDGTSAQLHVHHAAMMSFEDLWVMLGLNGLLSPGALVRSLLDDRAFCPQLHEGSCSGGRSKAERASAKRRPVERARHMAEWADLLRQAFIARRVLDRHSWHVRTPLAECEACGRGMLSHLGHFAKGRTKPYSLAWTAYPWPDELANLRRRWRKAEEELASSDLSSRSDRGGLTRELVVERNMLTRAFHYGRLESDRVFDPLYETLFVQYLRVKTAVYRMLVHPSGEHGLKNFLDHFNQIKVYAPDADKLKPRRPIETGLAIGAMEYRVSPDAWLANPRRREYPLGPQEARRSEECRQETLRPESAWLIHFKREKATQGLPLFGAIVRRLEGEAGRILAVLDADPPALRALRGIDVCGVEDHEPLWVSAETLRRVRRESGRIAARRPRLLLQPLRLTLHAGEDFTWLTTGVRAIAEPFLWKLIERGDRIGHGIALTLDPKKWWQHRAGSVVKTTRIHRLLDLAFLARYAADCSDAHLRWLEANIRESVGVIWPQWGTAQNLVERAQDFWCGLGERITRTMMQPGASPAVHRPHEQWIYSYLWNRSTRARADSEVSLRIGDQGNPPNLQSASMECDLLAKARRNLIREVTRWQVCVESNPTSNLVVGSLDSMAAQDFLQVRPTRVAKEIGDETLTWTISTDDPITFSTTLADEYAYAWAGMVLRKDNQCDPAYARALLDEAAATSMRMRFTIPNDDRNDRQHRRRRRAR